MAPGRPLILVDSSVWIDYLDEAITPQTRHLDHLLATDRVRMGDLILAEILRGYASDLGYRRARRELASLPVIGLGGEGIALAAAHNYRALRARGITVRSLIDTIIATRCIEDGLLLLHSDREFLPFEEHLGLRPAI